MLKIFALIVGLGTGTAQNTQPELFFQFSAVTDPCAEYPTPDQPSCPQQVAPLYNVTRVVPVQGSVYESYIVLDPNDTRETVRRKIEQRLRGQYRRHVTSANTASTEVVIMNLPDLPAVPSSP